MDKCIDHPDNIAVEACSRCGDYICGLHDRSLCMNHTPNDNDPSNLPIKIFLIVFGVGITFFFMAIVSEIIDTINLIGNAGDGDVITVDDEVATVTGSADLPDLTVIITTFFVVAVIMLSVIGLFIYRWTNATKGDDYSFIGRNQKDERTFYCQSCGQQLTMQDLECTECGKPTDDERKLLR